MGRQSKQTEAFDSVQFVAALTHKPGVYCMTDARERIIYVGKARDLKRRVSSYFRGRAHDEKTSALVAKIANVSVTVTRTEAEALMLEYNLIKQHKPRYNVLLKDDKSYPYIHISTDNDFPRVSFYRGSRKTKGRLFGPFPNAGSVRETLNQVQKLFQIRQCEDSYFRNRSRPCLQYQIERCSAPCVGLISKSDYLKDLDNMTLFLKGDNDGLTEKLALRMDQAAEKQEYERAAQFRDQLSKLKAVQSSQLVSRARGDFDVVAMEQSGSIACVAVMYFRGGRSLGSRNFFPRQADGVAGEEILRAFLLQYYGGREAPPEILLSQDVSDADQLGRMLSLRAGHRVRLRFRLRGDRRQWADLALTNACHAADLKRLSRATLARQFESLAQSLDLEAVPTRLECFDISHTAGEATVASCVVFGRGGPAKADYRRYNITGITAGDDYAAMAQALQRRYSRSTLDSGTMPELIFVDGGRGQLAAAAGVMDDLGFAAVPLVGIAKGQGRRPGRETLYPSFGDCAVHLAPNSEALHLVQQIRDEAHRFALAGHRGRRQKRVVSSSLEQVRGLGPKRRQALLRHFGGLQAVRKAPVDDIARVRGISTQLAQLIYDAFHAD